MGLETLFQLLLALAVVVVGVALLGALRRRVTATWLWVVGSALGAAAVAAWAAFALEPGGELAIAAAGLTATTAIVLGAVRLRAAVERVARVDAEHERSEARLRALVERQTAEFEADLEHALARARAESTSRLVEEERRIAEERRREVAAREEEAAASLSEAFAASQRRVERRLAGWAEDLDRAQQALAAQIARITERQQQALAPVESRLRANAERLEAEAEEQRAGVTRLKDDLTRAAQEAMSAAAAELETTQAERRRALHELNERLRRRERAMAEQIEREEADAARRIQASLADIERRQLEQVERSLARTAASFSEAAAQQFADAIKGQREEAARRLSRELDRGVQAFAREADRLLAERSAQVGDAGAQRLEKRLGGITAGLERQRDEFVEALERRLADVESDLRRRVQALVAETEAEREGLDVRLSELARRLDETLARVEDAQTFTRQGSSLGTRTRGA